MDVGGSYRPALLLPKLMQSTMRFGPSENGGVLFKARLSEATSRRFTFVRVVLGRSACLTVSEKPRLAPLAPQPAATEIVCLGAKPSND